MLNAFFSTPIPLVDDVFALWAISPAMSKLTVAYSLIAAYLICRLTPRPMVAAMPLVTMFLIAGALFAYWVVIDVESDMLFGPRRLMASLLVGESVAGIFVMAILRTGNRRTAGV